MNIITKELTKGIDIVSYAKDFGLHDIDSWTNPSKIQHLIDAGFWKVFIAELENEDVGIIGAGIEEEGRLWIELFSVSVNHRRKGIGRHLIQKLKSFGELQQMRGIFVDVDDDNIQAQKFYKSNGFHKVGKIKKYYYDDSASIIYFNPLIK